MNKPEVAEQPSPRIVAGLMRRGEEILLVLQQGKDDSHPTWALSGGVVEPGESLWEALKRELAEENGLLEALPWRSMREPVVAYLKREDLSGRAWTYR